MGVGPEKRPRTSPGELSASKRQEADPYDVDVDDDDEETTVFQQRPRTTVARDPIPQDPPVSQGRLIALFTLIQ
jgi:hypothetical protein